MMHENAINETVIGTHFVCVEIINDDERKSLSLPLSTRRRKSDFLFDEIR